MLLARLTDEPGDLALRIIDVSVVERRAGAIFDAGRILPPLPRLCTERTLVMARLISLKVLA